MQAQLVESIINASLDAIVCADEQGCITLWSPAAEGMFGYAESETLGQPLTMLMREQDRTAHAAGIRHFLQTGEGPMIGKVMQTMGLRKDGSVFGKDMSLSARKIDGAWCYTAIMHDTSERKLIEEALQQRVDEAEKSRQALLLMLEDLNESKDMIERAKLEWVQTFDAVTSPIFLHDTDGNILRANKAYAGQAGMAIEEVIGRPYWQVFPKSDKRLPSCESEEFVGEAVEELSTDDGTLFLIHSYVLSGNGASEHSTIHWMQDITARKQAEINLSHANRALATLSTVNHELVHATNEQELLQAICKAVVEQQGYRMAWVGYVQDGRDKSIEIMAGAGIDQSLLDSIRPGWGGNASGMGPSGRAVRSGSMQLTPDIAGDPEYPPWQNKMIKFGCNSGIALPMLDADKRVFGLLHVYAEQVNAFTDNEVSLLQETTDDLAFGVRALRVRLQRDDILKVNQQQLVQLRDNLRGTVDAISLAVEVRDPYTAGHQRRVAALAVAIAQELGLNKESIEGVLMSGLIHDIGKISVPAEILSKPGRLTNAEYQLIQYHPQTGYDILKGVAFPWPLADVAHQHHERLDGSGYPQGLKDGEICLEAKIVAVADVVEAMSSHRPYRAGLGIAAALNEIKTHRGTWFDTGVVDACLALFEQKRFSF